MNVIFLPDVAKVALEAEGISLDAFDILDVIRRMLDYPLLHQIEKETRMMMTSPSFLFYGSKIVKNGMYDEDSPSINNMDNEDAVLPDGYHYLEVNGNPELLIFSRGNGPVAPTYLTTFMKMNDHASASEVISSPAFQEWLGRSYPLRN